VLGEERRRARPGQIAALLAEVAALIAMEAVACFRIDDNSSLLQKQHGRPDPEQVF
jgi:hypothetical protein